MNYPCPTQLQDAECTRKDKTVAQFGDTSGTKATLPTRTYSARAQALRNAQALGEHSSVGLTVTGGARRTRTRCPCGPATPTAPADPARRATGQWATGR